MARTAPRTPWSRGRIPLPKSKIASYDPVSLQVSAGPNESGYQLHQVHVLVSVPAPQDATGQQQLDVRLELTDDTGRYDLYHAYASPGQKLDFTVTAVGTSVLDMYVNSELAGETRLGTEPPTVYNGKATPGPTPVTIFAPSLLSADFARIAEQIASVEGGGAEYLHLDVMDGRFVPNITWGPKIIGDLRKLSPLVFDAHLMIVEPERYVDDFRAAGCDRITFHLEATCHAQRLLAHLRSIGAKAGIAICPQTPVAMLQDVIEDCDTVLVMSVNPGFGGQKFIPRAIEKIREARSLIDARNPGCLVEVDGGVGAENLRDVGRGRCRCAGHGLRRLRRSRSRSGTAPPARASRVTEDEVVEAIRALCKSEPAQGRRIVLGIGDDAAIWRPSRSHLSAISSDMLVEGVDFTDSLMGLEDAGWRAMAANVSDLAAMGARPVLATVALGVARERAAQELLECYRGIAAAARHWHLTIAGGDLSRAPALTLAVTVVGEVRRVGRKAPRRRASRRRARCHGPLGNARAGLELARDADLSVADALRAEALSAFRRPRGTRCRGTLSGGQP